MEPRFEDRRAAGRELAALLGAIASETPVVLALPRGGLPVAVEVASALSAPLDVLVVRKLGVPGQRELAMGAIASGDVTVLNDDLVADLAIGERAIARETRRERAELARRERAYRSGHEPADVRDRAVIVVDDGLATGSTMRAAVASLRERGARKIVVAVPVAPAVTVAALDEEADEVVCVHAPDRFFSVGSWYQDFRQVDDDEVHECLAGVGG